MYHTLTSIFFLLTASLDVDNICRVEYNVTNANGMPNMENMMQVIGLIAGLGFIGLILEKLEIL